VFDLAVRRRWVTANPCKLVDAPAVPPSSEVRFLTQEELARRCSPPRLSSRARRSAAAPDGF
jgi:hypothetical protein